MWAAAVAQQGGDEARKDRGRAGWRDGWLSVIDGPASLTFLHGTLLVVDLLRDLSHLQSRLYTFGVAAQYSLLVRLVFALSMMPTLVETYRDRLRE